MDWKKFEKTLRDCPEMNQHLKPLINHALIIFNQNLKEIGFGKAFFIFFRTVEKIKFRTFLKHDYPDNFQPFLLLTLNNKKVSKILGILHPRQKTIISCLENWLKN